MEGYIFVNSEPQTLWQIIKTALGIEGIKMVHAVTGQFDIVAYAEFANMEKLGEIISNVKSIEGVQRTQTAVAIPPRLE